MIIRTVRLLGKLANGICSILTFNVYSQFYQKENNDDSCLNKVYFKKDGSVVFPNREDYTLNYGVRYINIMINSILDLYYRSFVFP